MEGEEEPGQVWIVIFRQITGPDCVTFAGGKLTGPQIVKLVGDESRRHGPVKPALSCRQSKSNVNKDVKIRVIKSQELHVLSIGESITGKLA